jgi:hypothetical protein
MEFFESGIDVGQAHKLDLFLVKISSGYGSFTDWYSECCAVKPRIHNLDCCGQTRPVIMMLHAGLTNAPASGTVAGRNLMDSSVFFPLGNNPFGQESGPPQAQLTIRVDDQTNAMMTICMQ